MSVECFPSAPGPSGATSTIPNLPGADGDYALRVVAGVGSWVRTPIFETMGVTDGVGTSILSIDPNDSSQAYLDSSFRAFQHIFTGNYFVQGGVGYAGGGYAIRDDNGDIHPVAFLDDITGPSELWLGSADVAQLGSALLGRGVRTYAGGTAPAFFVPAGDGNTYLEGDGTMRLIVGDFSGVVPSFGGWRFGVGSLFVQDPTINLNATGFAYHATAMDFTVDAGTGVLSETAGGWLSTIDGTATLSSTGDFGILGGTVAGILHLTANGDVNIEATAGGDLNLQSTAGLIQALSDVDMQALLLLNGSHGTAGQRVTSQGASDPTWT